MSQRQLSFGERNTVFVVRDPVAEVFHPIFNKSFDHVETLLTTHIPENVLSAGSPCRALVPTPQSKRSKKDLHITPKSIILQFQICYHSHLTVP